MQKPIWTHKPVLEEIRATNANTLCDHLGIVCTEVSDSSLTAVMEIKPCHLQSNGIMHGGTTAVLAESVASIAANHCVDKDTQVCVGLELNINHLRAVRDGTIHGIAFPLHRGRTTQVWEIKIYNNKKDLVSAARLTLAVINK